MTSTGARRPLGRFAGVVGALVAMSGLLLPTVAGASPVHARAPIRAMASGHVKKTKKSKKTAKHIAKTDTGQFACAVVPVAAWTTALGGAPTPTPAGGGPGAEGGTYQSKCFVQVTGSTKVEVEITDFQTPKAAKQFIAEASSNFPSHPSGIGDTKTANESSTIVSFARRNFVAAMSNSAGIPPTTFEGMAHRLAANL
jgi:hypothetical protein